MPSMQQARVKSVTSGDTLVLTSVQNPNQERLLSLAFVTAPRLRKDGEEPFAFASRDFLRKLVVGKVVQFQVIYTITPPGSKAIELGQVFVQTGQQLPDAAVAEGWLKIRENAGRNEESEEATSLLDKLRASEAAAKAEGKGMWSSSGANLTVTKDVPDAKSFVESHKSTSIDAVVEKVLSGDRLIVRLLLDPTTHCQTVVLIAGIRAPATKRVNTSDGKEQPGEEGSDASRSFVEERLLQRNVKVDPIGVTPQNQLVGIVRHPNGSIAEFVLKAGLARCTDFHSTMLGGGMAALRQAEKHAKDQKLGLFKGHSAPKASSAGTQEAVVSKVQSSDTIFLRNKAGAEKRVTLSSIRQPKPSDPKQAPFGADAKEFLRKRLIGKHIRFTTDATRPAQEGFGPREMVTVLQNDKNVALATVENGWASVVRHRRDDDDRSPIYDELLAAEEAAQKEQKGMWASSPPANKAYVDASESLQKAKVQFSILQRQRRVPAIVDFVKSGARFTVLVPKENAKLTFVLSGIRAPRSARNPQESSEPFGQEAHDFANKRCNQRDVEIDVEATDKVGGFIGTLYINRESFAKILVEEGFASVHQYSAEQSGNAQELLAAEKRAKEGRKGLWKDWDPSQEEVDTFDTENVNLTATDGTSQNGADAAAAPPKKDYRDVMITHVDETGRLKIQLVGPSSTGALTELMTAFRSFHLNSSNSAGLPAPPKGGDFVAAKFSEDGEWYRARIRRNDREKKRAEVLFIDYGNSEEVAWSSLRPLSQAQFSPQKLKPQASDAVLSFLQYPTQPDYLADAISYISSTVAYKQLVANVDFTSSETPTTLFVTLFDPEHSGSMRESVNADVVSEGLAMVPRKLKAWERSAGNASAGEGQTVLVALKQKEDQAKQDRKGMWEYGDLTED